VEEPCSTQSYGRLLAAVLALAAAPAAAQQRTTVDIPFEKYTLDKRLEVILAPDLASHGRGGPVVQRVQPRRAPGPHRVRPLFEHMMFEGRRTWPRRPRGPAALAAPPDLNGTTNEDRTNYYQVVPPNRLNLALWLEADRMRSLNVTAEQLRVQQEAVKEEKRMRVDNAPTPPPCTTPYPARTTGRPASRTATPSSGPWRTWTQRR
jgi:predicted Zn-dependent peptidase